MSGIKKTNKSKFISKDFDDLINESQFLKTSPKTVKTIKRPYNDIIAEEEKMNNLIDNYQKNLKKNKVDTQFTTRKETSIKLLNLMTEQLNQRKKSYDIIIKKLSEHLARMETDHNAFKENIQKQEKLIEISMKCIKQALAAYELKMNTLKEIKSSFEKEYEDLENNHKIETNKLVAEFEEDIKKLEHNLLTETKRKGWETISKTIIHAIQNDS